MDNLLPSIRNAARALIFRERQILLLRKDGGDRGERYALPGGAQDPGETLLEALNRECLEEIGTEVEMLSLLHVADFFKSRDTDPPSRRHLVEFLFQCRVPESYQPRNGHRPDKHQVEVVWAPLVNLGQMPFYCNAIASRLEQVQKSPDAVYLGAFD